MSRRSRLVGAILLFCGAGLLVSIAFMDTERQTPFLENPDQNWQERDAIQARVIWRMIPGVVCVGLGIGLTFYGYREALMRARYWWIAPYLKEGETAFGKTVTTAKRTTCTECGASNEADGNFCKACGKPPATE